MNINELLDILSTYPDKFFITTEDLSEDIKKELYKTKTMIQSEFERVAARLSSVYILTNSSLANQKNLVSNLLESNRISPLIKEEDIKYYNTRIIPTITNILKDSFYKVYSDIPRLMKDKSFIDANNQLSVELNLYITNILSQFINKWNNECRFNFLQKNNNTDNTVDRIRNTMIRDSLNQINTISNDNAKEIELIQNEIIKIKAIWLDYLIDNTIEKIDYLKHRSNGEFLNKDYCTIASNVILTVYVLFKCIITLVDAYCEDITLFDQDILCYLKGLKCSQEV